MKIAKLFKDFFGGKSEITINQKLDDSTNKLAIEMFAINMAINIIAGAIAKCEFKTYVNGIEKKGDEYYLWNVEPNQNQNSNQFMHKLISKLLFENEVLVVEVNGALIIADSFYQEEYACLENYFENVTIKDFTFSRRFYMHEVLYFKYNNEDIRALLSCLINGYNNLLNMAVGKYKRSGGRKGKLHLDAIKKGDKEYEEALKNLINEQFKEFFENENAVLSLKKGMDYEELTGEGNKKSTSELTDIKNLIDDVVTRVGQAFRIPPALIKGDIADIDKITKNFLSFCIDPLVDLLQTEINRKRNGKVAYLKGTKLIIDTTCIMHIDVFEIAEKIDKLISTGMYSIDELRSKISDTILNTDWSDKHWITKNYSEITQIDNLEGGDDSE